MSLMDPKPTSAPSPRATAPKTNSRPLLSADSDVQILDRLNAIYKHRQIVVTVFLLILIGVVLRTYTTIPMYRATSRVLIEDERAGSVAGFNSPTSGDYSQDPEPYYQTQYRILTGRELGAKVVRNLHLEDVAEFNGRGPQPTALAAVFGTMRRQALAPIRSLMGQPPEPGPTSAPANPVSEEVLIHGFISRVSVEPVRNSRLVDVAFISASPAFAARAADMLVEEYVKQNLELRLTTSETSLTWLSKEIDKQRLLVEGSERALAQYREDQNAGSLEDRQNIVVARLNQLNDAVTRAKTARMQKEAAYNQIKALGPNIAVDTIPAIIQNPFIQSLKTQLAGLQRDQIRLSERYGEKHPEIVKIRASIEDASKQLEAELSKSIEGIRNDYQNAVAEERTMTAALEEQKQQEESQKNRKKIGFRTNANEK